MQEEEDSSEKERRVFGKIGCINNLKRESLVMMHLQLLGELIHWH